MEMGRGQPGAILRDREHNVVSMLALDVLDGRIQAIRAVLSPDKLGLVGPVRDAWAIAPRGKADSPAQGLISRTQSSN